MTSVVTEKNEISIPEEIAREFQIKPGTRVEWVKTAEGSLTLRLISRKELADRLRGAGRKFLKPGQDPIADLIRERAEDGAF